MSTLIFCLFFAMQEEKNTALDDLVRKNQDHFALMKTISLEIDATISFDGGKSWEKMEKALWQKTTTAERFKSTLFGAFSDGRWEKFTDFSDTYDGKESRALKNFDPDSPPKLPIKPGTPEFNKIKGFIGPARDSETIRKKSIYLWLLFNADFSHSLFDLSKLNSDMKLVGLVDVEGKKLWELSFRQDGHRTIIYLDPKANCAISKLLYFPQGGLTKTACSVLEFREFPGGVFIPTHLRNVSKGIHDRVVDIKATNIKVNEELNDDALKVSFPEGIFVSDSVRDKIFVWGKNEPKLEFNSKNEDFKNWYGTQAQPADVTMTFIGINIALITLVVIVVLIRRRSRRRSKAVGDVGP